MAGVIVASGAYALSPAEQVSAKRPIIGWKNYLTAENVTATSETTEDPATNLGNPSTSWRWTSAVTTLQYLTSLFGQVRDVDWAGVCRHNWASAIIETTLQGLPPGGDANDNADWVDLIETHLLNDDGVRMWRFTKTQLIGFRWKLDPFSTAPYAAVARCGELTVLQGIPPEHTPIKFGDETEQRDVGNQGGDHLGIAIISRARSGNIVQQNVRGDWYRSTLEEFRRGFRDGDTFFFSWSPQRYPDEVGYCWRGGDATPRIVQTTGQVNITFPIKAVAL
ncbi:hypothetical protein [Devosia sp. Root105]|uniref:hypothetical protein n=1 Tax=Devosia sp. Root105 TaxID=1736423 RepID=UPI0006F43113|nr:hypothetical protein [Devosia sp. Root105]KQU96432.1 hypothetical protein ASC68_13720 [Devosia sp. Root105]